MTSCQLTPFAAKVLVTVGDERIRLTTEAELTRVVEDVTEYLEQQHEENMDNNQNQVLKVVEQGFHVTLGAISVATETLQNEQKRMQLISELTQEWNQRAQEWEEKGEATATEARRFIENFVSQDGEPSSTASSPTQNQGTSNGTPNQASEPARNDFPARLQALTDEVTTLREEMAQFRS